MMMCIFAFGAAHDTADGLDDINDGFMGIEKQHGIQRHVHAFGKAAGVGEDAAGVLGRVGLEPVEGVALEGVEGAVHVIQFTVE